MVSKSECLEWIKKRTILEKALLSVSSILLLTVLIMILIVVSSGGKKANSLNDETSCWSEECKQTAEVLKILEPEADACSSFYDYTCGKYGLEPGQTVSVARRSTDSVYFILKRLLESQQKFNIQGLEDVRSFYNICVNFGSYGKIVDEIRDSVLDAMEEVGLDIWPIVNSLFEFNDWVTEKKMERYLVSLILLNVPVAFQMEVVPDQQITGSYLVKISPGRPHETGRTHDEIRNDVNLLVKVLTSFFLIEAPSSKVLNDVQEILDEDGHLAAIEQDKYVTCDDVISLAPQEVESKLHKLIKLDKDFHWDVILSEIRNKTGLVRPFAVELHCHQRITNYLQRLNSMTEKAFTNYLGWRLFSEFMEIVVPTFEKFQFGAVEPAPRWRICLEHMEKFSSPIFADLLSREIVDKDIQEEVERMSNASLSATKLLVSRASWLSDVQRSRILEKVSKIRIRYPYKEMAHNGDALQIVIPKVDVTNFTQAVIHHRRKEMIQKFRRLNSGTESTTQVGSWEPLLTEVDNFASSDLTAYVYFDKIRKPYFRQQGSQWMNYGSFGTFIAREISRILISLNAGEGDEVKDLVLNVWSHSKASDPCFKESMFSLAELENTFLDHSALEIAYEAAKSTADSSKSLPGLDFSSEELFFLSYAQTTCEAEKMEQSLARKRLDASLSSFKSFSDVFNCESKSYCQIWA